jgi:hypothetical protein
MYRKKIGGFVKQYPQSIWVYELGIVFNGFMTVRAKYLWLCEINSYLKYEISTFL